MYHEIPAIIFIICVGLQFRSEEPNLENIHLLLDATVLIILRILNAILIY